MNPHKVNIDSSLVKRLVADQFQRWADLPVTEVEPNGWDNRTFRLGDRMSVRLPSAKQYTQQVKKEHRWLPELAPQLPLPIPSPQAIGEPAAGYPWQWSVYGWIDGETATVEHIADMPQFASSLAQFLVALQEIDSTGGPNPGPHNFYRGGDLAVYDEETRTAIKILDGKLETGAITEVWDTALASSWNDLPVWVHGDVSPGNLLIKDGRLTAVIDFGGLCVGDPACDLAIAWTMFEGESRESFRAGLNLDDATWARGRGWTLWKALIGIAGMSKTNAIEALNSRRTVSEIVADHFRNV